MQCKSVQTNRLQNHCLAGLMRHQRRRGTMVLLKHFACGLRRMDHGTAHFVAKCATESHITSAAHTRQVQLSAAISWMCGGVPFSLRVPHTGAPSHSHVTQSMCRAWWGPHVDTMRHRAQQIFKKAMHMLSCAHIPEIAARPPMSWKLGHGGLYPIHVCSGALCAI